MSGPLTSLIRPQFGVESTYGGGAAAARVFANIDGSGWELNPEQTREGSGQAGVAFETRNTLVTELSKGTAKGIFEYRDIGYPLACIYGYTSAQTQNPTTGVYKHTFEDLLWNQIVPQTYAVEMPGDTGDRAQGVAGLIFNSLKIDSEGDKLPTMSSGLLAKAISDAITPTAGANAVMVATLLGVPTGGTWILVCDNVPTSALVFDAAASAVQTAVRATGGRFATATVSGSAGGPYSVTIPDGLPAPFMSPVYKDAAGANTLTGGTTPSVSVTTTTYGGMPVHSGERVTANALTLSFAATMTALDNSPTNLTNEYMTGVEIGERFSHVWPQNAASTSPGGIVQKKASEIKDSVSLCMAYDAGCASFINNSRSGTAMFVRLKWVGSQIGSTGYFLTVQLDLYGIVNWKSNKDSQGNIRSVDFDVMAIAAPTANIRTRWTITNDVASYAS